tara:strand:- start:25 stop:312 length:288 start_codon:yes stop_codon:yes gene_type:complete
MKRTPLKRKTPLRRVSKARREASKIYLTLRQSFLADLPLCEVCEKEKSTDVHHKKGRGKYYLDVDTWLSVCRKCHDRIHVNPSWARENGFIEDRS